MVKKSTQVALGGLASSLCLLLMFMTGLIPFSTFAVPALAGMVLIAVVIENGYKAAALVYIATSFLSVFIVPDREAAMIFIFFFGYYPILKGKIEKFKSKILELTLKFFIFNISVVLAYVFIINILGIDDVLDNIGVIGKYSPLILLALGNIVFVIYDFALTNIIYIYIYKFRTMVFKNIK